MKKYFCLCPGGIRSDSDASVIVESFSEIQTMLDSFFKTLGKEQCTYVTQHILDRSPDKFPEWGKTYMILAVNNEGQKVAVGYCNFARTRLNSFSAIMIAMWCLITIAVIMGGCSIFAKHYDAAAWAFNSAILISILMRWRLLLIHQKMMYMLK